ncbi:MAG: PCP reductase family protein [Planctomycetes bacterium]|nr:PCP reductase family protein [Planctomycetota bacterium]
MPPPEAEAGASAPALAAPPQPAASAVGPITWSPEADERLKRIPIFVRPMAAKAIEDFARKRGSAVVTAEIMEAVKQAYGM